ncbi:hypothetical protein NKH63_28615 [Mesorhizobium sp. M0960]|uniref:hypothetical protein n=1 Tax=Mesorhizobium sp. M0960 TaxID=2957035 RepID=UPI0033369C4A
MEEGFVFAGSDHLACYRRQRLPAEVVDEPKIRTELESLGGPIVAFGDSVIWDSPNLSERIDPTVRSDFTKDCLKEASVKCNLRFVKGAGAPRSFNVNDAEYWGRFRKVPPD